MTEEGVIYPTKGKPPGVGRKEGGRNGMDGK